MNRTPTRANPGRAAPFSLVLGKVVSLGDFVPFGSKCTVFREAKACKALKKRAEAGIIIGKSRETKGYIVLLTGTRVVITTRHIQNIETVDEATNRIIKRGLNEDCAVPLADRARELTGPAAGARGDQPFPMARSRRLRPTTKPTEARPPLGGATNCLLPLVPGCTVAEDRRSRSPCLPRADHPERRRSRNAAKMPTRRRSRA
jgi:hypothetical protein